MLRLYHGLTLDTYCLMGELWDHERLTGRGCTVTQAAEILQCARRAAAKVMQRLCRAGHLAADTRIHLPRYAKTYRSTRRWRAIVARDPAAVPGICSACGDLSLPFPFEGRFLCGPCLRALDAEAEATALLRSLPLAAAVRVILDARPGYRHTAAGLREVLDGHPILAPYGWMGREQLCTQALVALPAEGYGTATDRLGRRSYWRRADDPHQ